MVDTKVPENIALDMLNEGASLITAYCKTHGISDKDQLSLRALHSSEIAQKTGYQKRTTVQLLDDLLNDLDTRQPYQAEAVQKKSMLITALIFMAEHPDYAQRMLELYRREIEPKLSNH